MDKDKFFKLMMILFKSYNIKMDMELLNIWYNVLKSHSIEEIRSACDVMINSNLKSYEVTAPRIIAEIKKIKTPQISEFEVKTDILDAISKYGRYKSPKFSTSIAHAIVEDIGWKNLCNMLESNVSASIHYAYINVMSVYNSGGELRLKPINDNRNEEVRGLSAMNGHLDKYLKK